MGKMSRDKGARSERSLVHLLRDFYGYDVRRGDCFRGEADVIGLWGVWIEVKATQTELGMDTEEDKAIAEMLNSITIIEIVRSMFYINN